MSHAVFNGSTFTSPPCFTGSLSDAPSVIWMNLLKSRRVFQFLWRVPEDLLVGKAVVNALAIHVNYGDHVGGILTDEAEKLLSSRELTADPMDLKLLIDTVKVKQQYHTDESPLCLLHSETRFPIFSRMEK
jgi:hypothetical protein